MAWSSADTHGSDDLDICRAVVEAVADAEGTWPADLGRPLSEVIDPDALNGLFADTETDTGRVVFRYHGYTVTVRGDGQVTLDPRPES